MTDNTVISPGIGGDTIRTVSKTATNAKTQVTLLDGGGGADGSPETIWTMGAAVTASSMPVTIASDQIVPVSMSGSVAVTGTTATGWRDDGSPQGVIRTEPVRAGLISIPLRYGLYTGQNNGTATGYSNTPANVNVANGDGTASGLQLTIPSSASFNSAGGQSIFIKTWFKGRVFGLRFDRSSGYTGGPISCRIDGKPYYVNSSRLNDPTTQTIVTANAAQANENWVMVATDLDPYADHYAEIMFVGSTTATYTHFFFGFVFDAAAGYQPAPLGLILNGTPAALTTSPLQYNPQAGMELTGYYLYNSSASAVAVSVAKATTGTAFWVKSIAAGDTAELIFPGIVRHSVYLSAATGAVVYATPMAVPHVG